MYMSPVYVFMHACGRMCNGMGTCVCTCVHENVSEQTVYLLYYCSYLSTHLLPLIICLAEYEDEPGRARTVHRRVTPCCTDQVTFAAICGCTVHVEQPTQVRASLAQSLVVQHDIHVARNWILRSVADALRSFVSYTCADYEVYHEVKYSRENNEDHYEFIADVSRNDHLRHGAGSLDVAAVSVMAAACLSTYDEKHNIYKLGFRMYGHGIWK